VPLVSVLITGWFSFEDGHATAGDLLAAEVVRGWLDEAGVSHVTAAVQALGGDVELCDTNPDDHEVVVFVCGPFENKRYEAELFQRFGASRLIGINLTLAQSPDSWNPFDVLLERDSPTTGCPDLVFSAAAKPVPVVGVCLVEDYEGGLTDQARHAIDRLLERFEAARIPVDTRLPDNLGGLRSPHEVEAVLAAVNVVVTTRLHGMVLALKHGVPALPIDPAPGGRKIARQARTIGWPISFSADSLTDERLDDAFRFCLSQEARSKAEACADRAVEMLQQVRSQFIAALAADGVSGTAPALRLRSRGELADRLATPTATSSLSGLWLALRRGAARVAGSKRGGPSADPPSR
jgi:hypothetical protein